MRLQRSERRGKGRGICGKLRKNNKMFKAGVTVVWGNKIELFRSRIYQARTFQPSPSKEITTALVPHVHWQLQCSVGPNGTHLFTRCSLDVIKRDVLAETFIVRHAITQALAYCTSESGQKEQTRFGRLINRSLSRATCSPTKVNKRN